MIYAFFVFMYSHYCTFCDVVAQVIITLALCLVEITIFNTVFILYRKHLTHDLSDPNEFEVFFVCHNTYIRNYLLEKVFDSLLTFVLVLL